MITIDPEFDINKFTAEYLDKNIERIATVGYEVLKGTKNKIKIHLKNTYSNYLKKVTSRYAKTKSFFYRDEAVYIEKFYVPLKLILNKNSLGKASINVILKKEGNFIITGLAGCGKSILMKYLLIDTLKNTDCVPVFVELREVNKRDIELMDLLEETLIENNLNLDAKYLNKAFDVGQFIFFLDGFDEVDKSKRFSVAKSIMSFAAKYSKSKVVVSSRPDIEFGGWKDFNVTSVGNLELDEACELINKLPYDEDIKIKFVEDLRKELFLKHKSFLSNPLLLSIMLLTYAQSSNIPNKLNVFYNQAYEALYQRHDALKGGYQRKRFTNLDIQDYAKVFSAFCVQTYDKRIFNFSRIEAIDLLKNSSSIVHIDFDAENFLNDSLQSTCLLIEDGIFMTFAHRSFQEYFTARFIYEASEKIQSKLLLKFESNLRSDSIFILLYEMNPEMVEQLYILPKLNGFFKTINLKSRVGIIHFTRFMQLCFSTIRITEHNITAPLERKQNNYSDILGFVLNQCGHLVDWKGFKGRTRIFDFYEKYRDKSDLVSFKLSELNSNSEVIKDLYKHGMFFSGETLEIILRIRDVIKRKHKNSNLSIENILLNK